MRILYNSKINKKPFGCLKTDEECVIDLHIPCCCVTNTVFLLFNNDNKSKQYTFEMSLKQKQNDYDIYSVKFCIDTADLYFYKFHIVTQEGEFDLFREGYSDTNMGAGDLWQLTVYNKSYDTPKSFKGKVMYQIFPDRFCREGEVNLDGKLSPYWVHSNTNDVPHYLPDQAGEILNNDFFGGNLRGITGKLDYLKKLGVSVIYLNPIFKAYSNHRYDTCDYKTIDPMLGDESDFVTLCKEAHRRGIKIILDGVFSHTGSNSVYFDAKHIFGNGAVSNPNSPYRDWYKFSHYPHKYESWWGITTLPCVEELNPHYMEYIITGEDSVVRHWLDKGADGFRLDVADELPDEFIKQLTDTVHSHKKGSLVIGEVWEDASNKIAYSVRRKYFSASELDSVMNYPFMNSIIALCMGNMRVFDFEKSIMTICENYPKPVTDCLMNSLSTHDTARIFTVLSGADLSLSKEQKAGYVLTDEQKSLAFERLFTAVFLQFILPGCPCIYYGDEVAMEGFGDPFNRGFFKWENSGNAASTFFAHMAKLKNSIASLQTGSISVMCHTDIDVMHITRMLDGEVANAVINRGNTIYTVYTQDQKCVVSHNATITDDKVLIHKGGFALFV